mmetsp:Transcript_134445/g.232548  ORF Transcript_134445/g.232548 Transcript_134445/m.232548 type:complete len:185 (-) Transcript_134445:238-792(-)
MARRAILSVLGLAVFLHHVPSCRGDESAGHELDEGHSTEEGKSQEAEAQHSDFQQKLSEIEAMMEARGADADPELKARLDSLREHAAALESQAKSKDDTERKTKKKKSREKMPWQNYAIVILGIPLLNLLRSMWSSFRKGKFAERAAAAGQGYLDSKAAKSRRDAKNQKKEEKKEAKKESKKGK